MESTTPTATPDPVPGSMTAKIEVTCTGGSNPQYSDAICKMLVDQLNAFKASGHSDYSCEIVMPYGHGKLTVTK